MSKRPSATIIPFPVIHRSQPQALGVAGDTRVSAPSAEASAVSKTPSRYRKAFDELRASPKPSSPENCIEYRAFKMRRTVTRTVDPAFVVRQAIHWTRRRPIALSSLPKLIRSDLETLCAAGDPTGLLVRDWLEGKGPKPVVEEGRA